jgi:hypothetical protein
VGTVSHENALRVGLLQLVVPDLFNKPGTVLYIGAHARRFSASQALHQVGHEITVVEIWQPFIEQLEGHRAGTRAAHIVHGDVREIDTLTLPHATFDYTLWLHGPEHLDCSYFEATVRKLEARTTQLVVMATPWGYAPHGTAYHNEHTRHRCHFLPEHFQRLGYDVAALGPKDKLGGHLLAWKRT